MLKQNVADGAYKDDLRHKAIQPQGKYSKGAAGFTFLGSVVKIDEEHMKISETELLHQDMPLMH